VRRSPANESRVSAWPRGRRDRHRQRFSDGFADNFRLFLPATQFSRFAVTREINDGLIAPRFSPSPRAFVLTGVRVPVNPVVEASTGRDADDR